MTRDNFFHIQFRVRNELGIPKYTYNVHDDGYHTAIIVTYIKKRFCNKIRCYCSARFHAQFSLILFFFSKEEKETQFLQKKKKKIAFSSYVV